MISCRKIKNAQTISLGSKLQRSFLYSSLLLLNLIFANLTLAQTPKLYHGEYPGSSIYNSNLNGANLNNLGANGAGILDLEVDKEQGFIFWPAFSDNEIYRSRLDGSSPTVLFTTTGNPYGIDFDKANDRLFVGHWSTRTLRCGSLDGSGTLTTMLTAPSNITDVEYNPDNNFLYYGVTGSGIWRVQMGAGCTTAGAASQIVVDNTGRPYGLTFNLPGNQMWWTNSTLDRISTSDLDGGSLNLNFCNFGGWLVGIDHYDGNLYFSDYQNDNTYVMPDNSCAPVALGNTVPNRPWGIAAVEFNTTVDIEKHTNGSDSDTPPGNSILVGDPVTWEYTVNNTGDTVLINPLLTDSDLGTVTNLISGDSDLDGELDVNETWVYQVSSFAAPGPYMNTGTFTGETDLNSTESLLATESDDSHYLGNSGPALLSFTSSTADNTYGPGSVINITANYSDPLAAGSFITVVLDNGISVDLLNVTGSSLTGTYTVSITGSGEDTLDLNVSSISAENAISLPTSGITTSSILPSPANNIAGSSDIIIDVTSPLLAEVTPVPTPGGNPTPPYTFSSNEPGISSYSGGCDSTSSSVNSGNNTVNLDADGAGGGFTSGIYNSCQLTVTDGAGNTSLPLGISSFEIDLIAPNLVSISSTSADNKYGPGFTINITASYDSALGSGSTLSLVLNNGKIVTLSTVSGNSVSTIYTVGATGSGEDAADLTVVSISSENVSDAYGNIQSSSTVPSSPNNLGDSSNIQVDTTAPLVSEVTAVYTPSSIQNPSWTYNSSEAGNLSFTGPCNSASLTAASGNNSLLLDSNGAGSPLPFGTYNSCQITVTDICGNVSTLLPLSIFVITNSSPGGITSGLELWFKANEEAWSDNGVTAATDGQDIERWGDSAPNSYDALQTEVARRPNLNINTLTSNNFNPTVTFNGSSDRMPILDKFYDASSSLDQVGVYVAYKTNLSGSWAFIDYDRSEWYNVNATGNNILLNYRGLTAIRDNSIGVNASDGFPHVAGFIYDNTLTDETVMRFDGAEVYAADREPLGVALEDPTTRFGYIGDGSEAGSFNSGANNIFYEGDISEIIVYDNNSFSISERRKIETYLALKYGVSLDASLEFYEDSTSSSVFAIDDGGNGGTAADQIADWQDIAGLSQDSLTSLNQRIAKSVNPTAELTAATDNDFTSPNNASRTSITDSSYLVWGHDGNSISSTQITDIDLAVYSSRIGREWKFENTNFSQSVNLKIDNLPALAPGKSYYLVTDADGDFTSSASTISSSTSGIFTNVTIPQGVNYITVGFHYDDVELEFQSSSSGDLEGVGGNIPLLLVNGTISGSLSVSASISSSSALPVSDYVISNTIIPSGTYDGTLATAVALNLSIVNDGTTELDEILNITLDPPINPAIEIIDLDGDSVAQDTFDYTIEDDDFGPGGVGDNVLFWHRADRDTSTVTDGQGISLWGDQLAPVLDAEQTNALLQPTFENQTADLWNFNPVVRFDGTDDLLSLPNSAYINLSTTPFKSVHLAVMTEGDVSSRQLIYEEGGGVRGFNAYIENGNLTFAGYNFASDGPGSPWDISSCEFPVGANSQYIATVLFKGNDTSSGIIDCFINGEKSSTPGLNVGNLYAHPGEVGIGKINNVTVFDDGTPNGQSQGSGAAYDGNLAEIIYFHDFEEDQLSQDKIESYLAIKYGVTLYQNAGARNYLNSVEQVTFDSLGSHSSFINDIAGINIDSGTDLIQSVSKSINSDAVFTIGNANNHDDYEALVWGNDNLPFNWTNALSEQGYERLERTWRFDELGDVGAASVVIDSANLPLLDKDEWVLLVDSDGDFSSGSTVYPLSIEAGVLTASSVEPNGDSYFTISQRDITPPTISLVTAVPTPGTNRTPPFTFSSTEDGTITLSGSCSSINTAALTGNNTIVLDANGAGGGLADGIYTDCQITVTDDCGNISNTLSIPLFEIYATIPNVSLTLDNSSISETGGVATFSVNLSNTYAAPVTVNLALSGTALASDYTNTSLTVTIPALTLSGTFVVTASSDSLDEPNETVIVDIASVINGNELGVQQQTTTIIDDDISPTVTLSINPGSIPEASGVAIVTATLSTPSALPVTVNLDFSASSATLGPDFSISAASITIPPFSLTGSMNVTAVDDTDDDDGEQVIVDISTTSNATELGVQQVSTTIIDDDIGCNKNPWLGHNPMLGTVFLSAHGEFTDSGSFLPPSGADFDTVIMGRTPADAAARRATAFNYFLTKFGIDWSTAPQIDASTWISASGDILLIHAMTDPRYEYRLNAMTDKRIHPVNGEVYEGVYLMVVMNPGGSVFYGTWGGAAGEYVPMGAAAVHGELFSTVPEYCNDGSMNVDSFYAEYQSLEPTLSNPNDKVLYNDEITNNSHFGGAVSYSLSRKGLYLEPGTLDYEAQVTNMLQFFP